MDKQVFCNVCEQHVILSDTGYLACGHTENQQHEPFEFSEDYEYKELDFEDDK